MVAGGARDGAAPSADEPPNRPPTFVWLMLAAVVALVFIAALFMIFSAPAPLKSAGALGPMQRAPAPPQQVAPSTPTPNPAPTDIR